MKTYVYIETYTQIFIAAFFIIAEKWKKPMSITDDWIKKMCFIYEMGCYSAIKTWNADTYYNMDEPWKHYAKWKKPVTKDHTLYNSIYV